MKYKLKVIFFGNINLFNKLVSQMKIPIKIYVEHISQNNILFINFLFKMMIFMMIKDFGTPCTIIIVLN